MNSSAAQKPPLVNTLSTLSRWIVGALFIYMGLVKALHPVDFLKLVHEYQIFTSPVLLNSIAAALPWFEVLCGLLLVSGVAVRGTALVVLAMLIPFTLLVLNRALQISAAQNIPFTAVKFDCGCGNGEMFIWKKMIENSVLSLLSLFVLLRRASIWALRYSLLPDRHVEKAGAQSPAHSKSLASTAVR